MVAQRYTVRRTNSSQAGGVTRYDNTILVVHYDRQLRGNSCRAGIDKNTLYSGIKKIFEVCWMQLILFSATCAAQA